jgi:hypothetical protein
MWRLMPLAEYHLGPGENAQRMLYLLGTGLAIAVILNGHRTFINNVCTTSIHHH